MSHILAIDLGKFNQILFHIQPRLQVVDLPYHSHWGRASSKRSCCDSPLTAPVLPA